MSGGETTGLRERCPDCAMSLVGSDPRFGRWCRACDWNVEPAARAERPGRIERRIRRIEARLGQSLYEELAGHQPGEPGRGIAAVAAVGLAAVVHLFTLGMVVLAGWLLYVAWNNPFAWIAALTLTGAVIAMRPRFGRVDKDAYVMTREQAPRLFALVDRVSEEVGLAGSGPRPEHIVLDTAWNAGAGLVGIGRRPVLTLGLPLWIALTPQERVDLLGHEIGHFVNGDARRGRLLAGALGALTVFAGLVRYDEYTFQEDDGGARFAGMPARILLWVVSLAPRTVLLALRLLTLRSGQRAEYVADHIGARVGGSDATVSGLEKLLIGRSCLSQLAVSLRRPGERDLWEVERSHVRGFPKPEIERLLRAAEIRGARVDESHPPTHLRIRLSHRPEWRSSPAVVLGRAEAEAIERELAPAYEVVGAQLKAELLREMYQ